MLKTKTGEVAFRGRRIRQKVLIAVVLCTLPQLVLMYVVLSYIWSQRAAPYWVITSLLLLMGATSLLIGAGASIIWDVGSAVVRVVQLMTSTRKTTRLEKRTDEIGGLVESFSDMVDASRRLGAGDLTARTDLPYEGELGQVARAFDEMAEALQMRETQAKKAEEELRHHRETFYQHEKLGAMTVLLAGVAHELNNPLSIVLGRAALLREMAGQELIAEQAVKIADAAERCVRIVKSFLALARQHPTERQRVTLNQVVRQALEVLAYPLRVDTVEVRLNLDPDPPVLWADAHQLLQVVVNLVSNAQQAMRETPLPRQLTLTTRSDPRRSRVFLEVADTGPGIPPEVQSRIFEPFFTTKAPGQGTGLGLSICERIVKAQGGDIRVDSQSGKGAVFLVELPAEAPSVPEPGAPITEASSPIRGKTILVVDDEPEVAATLADLLWLDGHRVELALNGIVALERLRERDYDLILTDIKMPELNGLDLYRTAQRRDPRVVKRFVFLTGDALNEETTEFLQKTTVPTLRKPFALDEVRQVARQVLGA